MDSGLLSSRPPSSVADRIALVLADAGVEMVFGLPGGETLRLLTPLHRHGLQFYLTHHEAAAVYMAATVARIQRGLGVALVTLGPGAANAVPGMAHAFLDRAPVLLFSAQTAESASPVYTHQRLALEALFRPISKASATITAENVEETLAQAIDVAHSGRPGPVHLAVSHESAGATAGAQQSIAAVLPELAARGPWQIEEAQRLLSQCQRPLIVAGLGLEPEAPYEELQELAEQVQAPVVTTPKAKGALSDRHPLAAATIGLTMTDPGYALLAETDCVLAIGLDVIELVRPWEVTAPLIWLAPWPNVDPLIPAAAALVGSLRRGLKQLRETNCQPAPDWGRSAAARQKRLQTQLPALPENGRAYPHQILSAVRDCTPPETQVVVDVGAHKILASLIWPALRPNRFHLSNGLSIMGYGLAGAVAAARCQKDLVVCLTGDGGLAMAVGELTGLTSGLNAPLVIIVFNDGALELIRTKQELADMPELGTRFVNPNFSALASAYGLNYARASGYDTCAQALGHARVSTVPTLLEAVIDPAGSSTAVPT
ncbi:MAG: thiamine pyrophosphate-binding protein [Candidatus Promineifilaceae bacterium]|nr:thiamine pyrophosphate-binding protein [Candidatus Promineifilaceae bacterium]